MLAGRQPQRHQRLHHLYRRADAVDHRHAQFAGQLLRQSRHAAAAQHDGTAAILLQRLYTARTHLLLRQTAAVFQRQHREIDSMQRRAVVLKAILVQQMTGNDQRARQRGNYRKARRHQRRHMHGGFRNADYRPLRQLARRQQARIAKAGDDVTIHALLPAFFDLFQDTHGGDGLIEVAFYGRHARARADREDLRPRRRHRAGRRADGFRHGEAGVGVDHLYTDRHYDSLWPANSRAKSGRHSPARSKQRLATICSKWCMRASLSGSSAFWRSRSTSCS